MSSSSDEFINLTPPQLLNAAKKATLSLLPEKSTDRYLQAYQNFILWKTSQNENSFSQTVFLAYFMELSHKYKSSSLWCYYSMLKSTMKTNHGIDIKSYSDLLAFLKRRSDGLKSKKSKVFSADNIKTFLKEAPDCRYLATKVALIFGINGACRRQELASITTNDIENHGRVLLVQVKNTKNKIPRSFIIQGPFYDIVKKYEALRSTKANSNRFFQNYHNGKCTKQPIGINKFGAMPKEIATFLNLPEAHEYTGHSFRSSSATLLADSGADLLTLKRHGGWRSSSVAEGYIDDSMRNKEEITSRITRNIHLESSVDFQPSTSTHAYIPPSSPQPQPPPPPPPTSAELCGLVSPTFTQESERETGPSPTAGPSEPKRVCRRLQTAASSHSAHKGGDAVTVNTANDVGIYTYHDHEAQAPDQQHDGKRLPLHVELSCKVCHNDIIGFRYTCVQCADWDMCASCEGRGEHPAHYVLRLPAPKPSAESARVLAAIRREIHELLRLHNEIHEISIKEEPVEKKPGPSASKRKCEGSPEASINTESQVDDDSTGDDDHDITPRTQHHDFQISEGHDQNELALHEGCRCQVCHRDIIGFCYTCVQCADWDMCASCEARGEHPAHYVLRLPAPKPSAETEGVLAAIRKDIEDLLKLKLNKEMHEIIIKEEDFDEVKVEMDTTEPMLEMYDRCVPEVEQAQQSTPDTAAAVPTTHTPSHDARAEENEPNRILQTGVKEELDIDIEEHDQNQLSYSIVPEVKLVQTSSGSMLSVGCGTVCIDVTSSHMREDAPARRARSAAILPDVKQEPRDPDYAAIAEATAEAPARRARAAAILPDVKQEPRDPDYAAIAEATAEAPARRARAAAILPDVKQEPRDPDYAVNAEATADAPTPLLRDVKQEPQEELDSLVTDEANLKVKTEGKQTFQKPS